jgi:putative phosphoesterase
MRVAILSDTHGVLDPRIGDLVGGCDLAVHGGDIGNAEVLTALEARSGRLAAVRGNNDVPAKWPAADHRRLAELPDRVLVELPGGVLAVDHGHEVAPVRRRHEILRLRYPQARAVVYGHSHRLVLDTGAQPWILNPGAAGRARTYGGPSCILLRALEHAWTLEVRRFPLATAGR